MKKRFTRILAALALLIFTMPSLVAWGQSTYTKVTTTPTDWSGTYVIVADESNVIFTGQNGNNNYGGYATVTISNGSVTGDFTAYEVEIETSGSYYSIKHTNSGKYLGLTSDGNNLNFSTNAPSGNNNNYRWSLSTSKIVPASFTARNLQYNSANNSQRFACYKGTQKDAFLYKKEVSTTNVAEPSFAPSSCSFGGSIEVQLSCSTENAIIHYSTVSNPSSWETYSGAISLNLTTTVWAYASKEGMTDSEVVSATYTALDMQTIAEARAQGTGAVYTQGTVTSISGSSAYIQDATAAINVYGNNTLVVGKKYTVVGTLTDYNGLLEITSPTCTEVEGGTVIAPQVMTIADILTSTNQGWFIKIEGATVGEITTQNNGSTNTTLTQGNSSIVARNISGDYDEGDVINLTGNIGHYGENNQIANPIVIAGPTITVDETELSFTYLVGATEAPQEILLVEGANLEGNVTVELSGSAFKMSGDGETWSTDNIVLTPTEGTLDETMIGVMLNTGLEHGTYNGAITLTSTNAETVTVTLTGTVTNQTYAINLTQPTTGGTISADKETAEAGQTVTLTAEPATGYAFASWTVLKDDLETEVEVNNNQFVMPNCEVLVSGTFSQANYTITVAETTNGTVECEDQTAHYGAEVLVTVTPAEGYRVASFTVTENGGEGSVTDIEEAEGLYSFDMPAFNIIITVVFEEQPDVYGGEGTFNKVTELTELEDGGYYVLAYDNHALKASYYGNTTNEMASASVTPNSNNEVIDPAKDIVWKLEKDGNNWNLYNEEIGKYCCITANSTTAFSLTETAQASYTVSLSNEAFTFATTATGSRCISYYSNNTSFRSYAASNATTKLTLYKLGEASQDPYITVSPDAVTVPGEGGNGTLTITYDHLTISGSTDFTIQYYDEDDSPVSVPAWMNNVAVAAATDGYVVNYTIAQNNDADREARFKLLVGDVSSNLVTFTQSKYVAPVTYSLATEIESGRHYIITNGTDKAMGAQGNNNRPAVDVQIEDGVATVSSADVYEFVINGPDADGFYTIYDKEYNNNDIIGGYLYAASNASTSYLRTRNHMGSDSKDIWNIVFSSTPEEGVVITSQGIDTRNIIRYNTSGLFNCYSSGQQPIFLYVKDDDTNYEFFKDIKGYGNAENGNYYLIASPVASFNPENTVITSNNYDLYAFDEAQDKEWRNYEAQNFNIAPGKGYLYANSENVTIAFTGTLNTNASVTLNKTDEAQFSGMNLVGNPFGQAAYINKSFYRMNEDGDEVIEGSGAINPMEGIFVVAGSDGETLNFSTTAPGKGAAVAMNVNGTRGNVIDRAIVRFDEGDQLPKFQLNPNNTKIYVTEGNQDFAVVRSANEAEMPVSFKASENGTYTLAVETENVEMNYLHLIDNLTGMDVDLLQTPSYTFEAKTSDYASRFRLVFKANGTNDNEAETFAYFNGSSWTISNVGEATLQVVDVTGRMVSNETISGNATISLNQTPGVYMLRLVNGDNVKTQKVVVR